MPPQRRRTSRILCADYVNSRPHRVNAARRRTPSGSSSVYVAALEGGFSRSEYGRNFQSLQRWDQRAQAVRQMGVSASPTGDARSTRAWDRTPQSNRPPRGLVAAAARSLELPASRPAEKRLVLSPNPAASIPSERQPTRARTAQRRSSSDVAPNSFKNAIAHSRVPRRQESQATPARKLRVSASSHTISTTKPTITQDTAASRCRTANSHTATRFPQFTAIPPIGNNQ